MMKLAQLLHALRVYIPSGRTATDYSIGLQHHRSRWYNACQFL